jgi:hypothetical protein
MSSFKALVVWGTLAPCFALVLSSAGFSQSSNSYPSTPAELAQTQQLNQNGIGTNNVAVAQNKVDNAKYQTQLAQYRARVKNYQEQAAGYEAARDRYVEQRAKYRRSNWPSRYEHNIIVDTNELLGASVHTSNGHVVGHVEEISLASGHVDALRVTLDRSRGNVWIESADLRFDADKKVVLTDLNRLDLYEMTHESY